MLWTQREKFQVGQTLPFSCRLLESLALVPLNQRISMRFIRVCSVYFLPHSPALLWRVLFATLLTAIHDVFGKVLKIMYLVSFLNCSTDWKMALLLSKKKKKTLLIIKIIQSYFRKLRKYYYSKITTVNILVWECLNV